MKKDNIDENIKTDDKNELCDIEYVSLACEAVLFAVGSAVSFDKIALAIGTDSEVIPAALEKLKEKYEKMPFATELVIYDGYAQFVTRSEYGEIVRKSLELRKNQPLSRAALEVLAIIAYNQPCTRAFIDKVRGVESPSVVGSLAEKGLIEEKGRLDAPGKPVLYGTTYVFLRTFGLTSIDELSKFPELEQIQKEYAAQFEKEQDIQQEMDIGDGKLSENSDNEN